MAKRRTFDYITKEAKAPKNSWSNREYLYFHYFNPNGAYKKWAGMCETITQYVDAGTVKSGWILAYGSLSCTYTDDLHKFVSLDRLNSRKLRVLVKLINQQTDTGYTNLAELHIVE